MGLVSDFPSDPFQFRRLAGKWKRGLVKQGYGHKITRCSIASTQRHGSFCSPLPITSRALGIVKHRWDFSWRKIGFLRVHVSPIRHAWKSQDHDISHPYIRVTWQGWCNLAALHSVYTRGESHDCCRSPRGGLSAVFPWRLKKHLWQAKG